MSGFLFYAVTVLSVYEGLVWLLGGYGLSMEQIVENRMWTKGDTMHVKLRLRRRFSIPLLWIKVEPELPWRLQMVYRPEMTFRLLWFRRTLTFEYQLSPLPRGQFVVGEVRITIGDLFGLMNRRMGLSLEHLFVVYPRYRDLRRWVAGAGEDQAIRTSASNRKLRQQELTLTSGIRDWQPGDRLNQIHWKVSARTAGLKSKLSERHGTSSVLILLDLYRHSYSKTSFHLLERGIELALSLAYTAVSSGLSVGMVAEGQYRIRLMPKADRRQLLQLFHYLAVEEAVGDVALPSLIQALPEQAGSQELVLITPRIDAMLMEAVRQRVQVQRKTSIQIFWLTDSEDGRDKTQAYSQLLRWGVPVYKVEDDHLQHLFLQRRTREGGDDGS